MAPPGESYVNASDSLHLLLKDFTSLNRAVELQTVLQRSIEIIQHVMQTEASSLMLLDENTGELVVSMPSGPVQKEVRGERISEGMGVGGWVLKNKEPYYSNDVKNIEVFAGDICEDFHTRNIICVPLINNKGQVIGVLQAINRLNNKPFAKEDIPVFEALSNHVSIAIERTRETEKLQKELQEKELMLTEVHHRIKNNLSTITSLIEMELAEVDNEIAERVLRKTCSRIESMTGIHDLLYNSGLDKNIDLGMYLERLIEKVSAVVSDSSQEVTLNVEMDSVFLDTDRVMSCGLLVNELLLNSYKHAFTEDMEDAAIAVKLMQKKNDIIILQVSDNGEGLADQFSFDDAESVGSWLIDVLLRKLGASININTDRGTEINIRFSK